MRPFPLAPMSSLFSVMTWVLLFLPIWLGAWAPMAPSPVSLLLAGAAAFTAALYVVIWLWSRPSRFELGTDQLEICWPLRRAVIPTREVEKVELINFDEVRRRYPGGMRVGAGGMWGAFGRYVASAGTLRMYISRMDQLVLIRQTSGVTWLLSPADAGTFVDALASRSAPRS